MFRRTPRNPAPLHHAGDVTKYRQRVRDIDAQLPRLDARRDVDEVRQLVDMRNAYASWLGRHGHTVPPMPAIKW